MARILAIDDDAPFRTVLSEILATAGHRVLQAEDGRQAIELIQHGEFDLVITDILMPGLDGIEMIMALRHRHPGLPVIAMSGAVQHSELYLRIAGNLGVRCTLAKPFTAATLLESVDAALRIAA